MHIAFDIDGPVAMMFIETAPDRFAGASDGRRDLAWCLAELDAHATARVAILRSEENGLFTDSEVEIDLVQAIRRERIGVVIGQASDETMFNVDQALRRWLAL